MTSSLSPFTLHIIPAEDAPSLAKLAEDEGFLCARVNPPGLEAKSDLMQTLAEQLRFPQPWGENWDALYDYLRDLSWLEGTGILLEIELPKVGPLNLTVLRGLIDVLLDIMQVWQQRSVPFYAVFIATPDYQKPCEAAIEVIRRSKGHP